VLSDAAADLAALSVAGAAAAGLHGCDPVAMQQQLSCSTPHACPAGQRRAGMAGSVLHLPLHAGVAWRLWRLAAGLSGGGGQAQGV
jgi:hypothetical protein